MNIQPPEQRLSRDAGAAPAAASVARGNIYLSREICERFLAGVTAVTVISRDERVLIVPLSSESAGGMLLKIRNGRGDRVIHAQEFFRARGYREDSATHAVEVSWSAGAQALVVAGIPKVSDHL